MCIESSFIYSVDVLVVGTRNTLDISLESRLYFCISHSSSLNLNRLVNQLFSNFRFAIDGQWSMCVQKAIVSGAWPASNRLICANEAKLQNCCCLESFRREWWMVVFYTYFKFQLGIGWCVLEWCNRCRSQLFLLAWLARDCRFVHFYGPRSLFLSPCFMSNSFSSKCSLLSTGSSLVNLLLVRNFWPSLWGRPSCTWFIALMGQFLRRTLGESRFQFQPSLLINMLSEYS